LPRATGANILSQMTNAEIVLAVVAWIELRLKENIPVPALASKAGYSLHHFVRLFGGVVGMPPKEYMLRRKLSQAARDLEQGRRRITDVAFEYGFNDLETFSRAFRRELGATPSAVGRGGPFPYTPACSAFMPAGGLGITEPPALERCAAFFLAGWSIRVRTQTNEVGQLWARFMERAPGIRNTVEPRRFRQIASWSEGSEDAVDIMAGIEVRDLTALPIDLVGKAVPSSDCLVFTHRGSVLRIADSYRAVYEKWLPASDRKPSLPFNYERYPEGAGDPYADSYTFQICVPVT
jgi:AraC family transcriptional regulator